VPSARLVTGIPTDVQRSDGRANRSLLVEAEARRAEWFPWCRHAWSPQERLGGASEGMEIAAARAT
jgi:hypothetical protein